MWLGNRTGEEESWGCKDSQSSQTCGVLQSGQTRYSRSPAFSDFLHFRLLSQGASVSKQVQDGPEPPGHVKKRLTKKLHFLERVADSKHKALAATAGIRKKPHKSKSRQKKALPDLHSLAELLADVEQKQQKQAAKQDHTDADNTNKQKGRTEQINGSKARRTVTYALSFTLSLLFSDSRRAPC